MADWQNRTYAAYGQGFQEFSAIVEERCRTSARFFGERQQSVSYWCLELL